MQIGDNVEIMITGVLGRHRAEVYSFNPRGQAYLQVLDEPGWPILKPGDYVIMLPHLVEDPA